MYELLRLLRSILVELAVISRQQQTLVYQNGRTNSLQRAMIRQLTRMETSMATNQEKIDAAAAALATAVQGIRDDVQALKDQVAAGTLPENLDFSALDASVAAAGELDVENPAPPVV